MAKDAELLSGGEMLVRALGDAGVRLLFGYPGGAALHIYDALFRQDTVQHILVRHEQAATHAADGYARATGQPGAVLVTSGPGATNTITGIATAQMDSIPLVVISAQVAMHLVGTDAFQETDMLGVSRPVVKHSFQVRAAEDIPDIVRQAFHIASTGRPGPVVIDVPKNTTDPARKFPYRYPKSVSLRSYRLPAAVDSSQLERAALLLSEARRPMIYAGGGVVQGNASPQLVQLAQQLNAPVTNTLMGLGAYPGDDRRFVGMLGMHGFYEANMAMHHCDVLLAVGARFDDRITNAPEYFCPDAAIIHIDIDPASVGKIIEVELPIIGIAADILDALAPVVDKCLVDLDKGQRADRDHALADWWQQIEDWRDAQGLLRKRRYQPNDARILPQQVVQSLYEVTGGDAYVSSDVGQHQMFVAQYYPFKKPRRWINSGGLGTMGFGLPAAMGVQLAFPDATVACVTGEGSIQMMIQELSTCLQYGLPIKIININNEALGMVRQWQDMQYGGRYSHSTYQDSLPDFVRLAESYGHIGLHVDRPEELEPAMRRCFEQRERLVFLDVRVDESEHVYPMLIAGTSLSDMWLSKDERTPPEPERRRGG